VVLPRVSYAQLRHFATSLPEALTPLYPNTRSVEIPNSSLPLIATCDFGTFGTIVSTSYPPICQNVKILTRHQRGSHDGTSHLFGVFFGLHDFANPDAELSVLRLTKPRNGQQRFDLLVNKYATYPLCAVRFFCTFKPLNAR
jgi:hypothetical protein